MTFIAAPRRDRIDAPCLRRLDQWLGLPSGFGGDVKCVEAGYADGGGPPIVLPGQNGSNHGCARLGPAAGRSGRRFRHPVTRAIRFSNSLMLEIVRCGRMRTGRG
jgi:hypothetical protein